MKKQTNIVSEIEMCLFARDTNIGCVRHANKT